MFSPPVHSEAEPEIIPSRSGAVSAKWNGRWLYSRVDPQTEAERTADRLIAEQELQPGIHQLVLLDAGVGHLAQVLHKRSFPVLLVAASEVLAAHAVHPVTWSPGMGELQALLDPAISDRKFLRTRVILAPMPQDFTAGSDAAAGLWHWYHGRQRSILTGAAFGRQWLRNAVLQSLRGWAQRDKIVGSGPLLLVFPGPSLEDMLATPARRDILMRSYGRMLAATSALAPLAAEGISPAFAVATDGGFYASLHYRPLVRKGRSPGKRVQLLASTSARIPHQVPPDSLSLFRQGELPDRFAPRPSPEIPPGGTVATSAIRSSLALGFSPVVLCGLDLAVLDGREHARPHAFDRYRKLGTRTAPAEHREFSRLVDREIPAGPGLRSGPEMQSYQDFLSRWLAQAELPVYRLGPCGITGVPEAPAEVIGSLQSPLSERPAEESDGPEAQGAPDTSGTLAEWTQQAPGGNAARQTAHQRTLGVLYGVLRDAAAGRLRESEEDFLAAAADFPAWRDAGTDSMRIRDLATILPWTFLKRLGVDPHREKSVDATKGGWA